MIKWYKDKRKDDEAMKDITKYLLTGADNATTREQLQSLTGLSDRRVRAAIEYAREQGAIIISSSMSGGYWLPSDKAEILEFVNETRSRIAKLKKMKAGAEKYLLEVQNDN